MEEFVRSYYASPIGMIEIAGTQKGILSILYVEKDDEDGTLLLPDPIVQCRKELDEYFAGERVDFSVPVLLQGTAFRRSVWEALCGIPYGETRSYQQIALCLGKETAVRAVGNANGKNCINIVIPCHRVIGSKGSLVGYGGGLWRKEWLLEHERRHAGSGLNAVCRGIKGA